MSSSLFTLASVIGLWLFLVLLCCGGSNSRYSTTPDGVENSPTVSVAATVLVAAYEGNEVDADQRYKGKRLIVTGTIDSIGKDIMDSMYVTLGSGKDFSITSVQCFFDDASGPALARLRKGEVITVAGMCDGKFGNVLLKDCSLR